MQLTPDQQLYMQVRPEPCTVAELKEGVRKAAKGLYDGKTENMIGYTLAMLRALARKYPMTPFAADIADVMGEPELANQWNPLEASKID
jgi:hypothetical protein